MCFHLKSSIIYYLKRVTIPSYFYFLDAHVHAYSKFGTINDLKWVTIPIHFYFLVMHIYLPIPWLFIIFIATIGGHKGGGVALMFELIFNSKL